MPETSLYALVDAARDPRLYDWLRCDEHWCLYSGEIAPALRAVAPYLVRMNRNDSPLHEAWQREGWGKSWGLFCYASANPEVLRRHFRRFLTVQLPDGGIAQYRFYDPRVFRSSVVTTPAHEIGEWFESVEEYLVESRDGGTTRHYRWLDGVLRCTEPEKLT